MSDIFVEQIISRHKNNEEQLKSVIGYIITLVVCAVILIFLPNFITWVPIFAILGFAISFHFAPKSIEYEYIFTNTDLDIDIIYNRSKRKRAFTTDLKDCVQIYK